MADAESLPAKAIRTLKFKVHPDAYAWLNQAAIEVNQVWNFNNETSFKAIRPFAGKPRWLSGFDLCNLTSGATAYFEHIGADTIQRVCQEYAQKRIQAKRVRLRFRKSFGTKRDLGWIPFKAASLRRHGKYIKFYGKVIRFFEAKRLQDIERWGSGCFAQDPSGDWSLCLPVELPDQTPAPERAEVGLDLGLKDTIVSSEGERWGAGRYYRDLEAQIARAQRRGRKRQVKRLHRKAARRRKDTLHKASRYLINRFQRIIVGDVSAPRLARTRMAKAVLDSGWGLFRAMLLYKGGDAGRIVKVVNERNTTRACSSCGALTGPQGVNGLRMRTWTCQNCGVILDRDVNAAMNVLSAGRSPPSLSDTRSRRDLSRLSRANPPARRHG